VADKAGKKHALYTCVETKGIVGSDTRNYLLDVVGHTIGP
jgi:hypothetical protein